MYVHLGTSLFYLLFLYTAICVFNLFLTLLSRYRSLTRNQYCPISYHQVAQQQYVPLLKPGKKEGSGGSTTSGVKEKERKLDKLRRKNRHPPRLKNIDRSTAQSNEVTVNNVTVTITEYKPKVKKGSDQSSNASSEGGSQHDSNQDSRSLDVGTDA